jgi:ubiquinone/menaquinone biosynthesis C-methylase UbiE
MPDVWAAVTDLDAATQARLADVLETRGADPQQRELRRAFLVDIDIPADALVLEVGCGTGVLTRALAQLPAVASVIGVDVAPSLLERARQLASDLPAIESREGDARSLPFEDEALTSSSSTRP